MQSREIESGVWQTSPHMVDYRVEWPGDMLVERATWTADAPARPLLTQSDGLLETARAGYIWFRFWLPDDEQLVERYFDSSGEPLGTYIPICMPLERRGQSFATRELLLALWISADGDRVTVLNEDAFDAAVEAGALTPVESERAELRIRELTSAVVQKLFPPALVRNFTINVADSIS